MVVVTVEAAHAHRFDESLARGGMFGPGGPQIVGDADMPAVFRVFLSVTVVAHVQHDGSVGEFGGHAFGDVVAGRLAGRPGAAVVFAPGDVGKRRSVAVASLRGNDQSAVGQCDAVAGCRSVELPQRDFLKVFNLAFTQGVKAPYIN